jgi:hypothetical protein
MACVVAIKWIPLLKVAVIWGEPGAQREVRADIVELSFQKGFAVFTPSAPGFH